MEKPKFNLLVVVENAEVTCVFADGDALDKINVEVVDLDFQHTRKTPLIYTPQQHPFYEKWIKQYLPSEEPVIKTLVAGLKKKWGRKSSLKKRKPIRAFIHEQPFRDFQSIAEAASALGFRPTTISNSLRFGHVVQKTLTFKYLNQKDNEEFNRNLWKDRVR